MAYLTVPGVSDVVAGGVATGEWNAGKAGRGSPRCAVISAPDQVRGQTIVPYQEAK